MRRIQFTVLGKPEPQGSMKAFIAKGRGGATVARVASDNAAMRPWRQQVGWEALRARAEAGMHEPWPQGIPIRLCCLFTFVKPKSANKLRLNPTVKPDLDKLQRAIGDALTGVLYTDDAQIIRLEVSKHYGAPARAEIVVEALP